MVEVEHQKAGGIAAAQAVGQLLVGALVEVVGAVEASQVVAQGGFAQPLDEAGVFQRQGSLAGEV